MPRSSESVLCLPPKRIPNPTVHLHGPPRNSAPESPAGLAATSAHPVHPRTYTWRGEPSCPGCTHHRRRRPQKARVDALGCKDGVATNGSGGIGRHSPAEGPVGFTHALSPSRAPRCPTCPHPLFCERLVDCVTVGAARSLKVNSLPRIARCPFIAIGSEFTWRSRSRRAS